jgi:hypothetical protein
MRDGLTSFILLSQVWAGRYTHPLVSVATDADFTMPPDQSQ